MTINAPNPRTRNIDPKTGTLDPALHTFFNRIATGINQLNTALGITQNNLGSSSTDLQSRLAAAQAELNGTINATAAELNGAINQASSAATDAVAGVQGQIEGLVIPSIAQPHAEHVLIDYADDRAYPVIQYSELNWTIENVIAKCATGSCTVTVSVDGAALGGGANSVTAAESTVAHAASNTVASGATITVTISSNSSAESVAVSIIGTKSLDS